MGLHSARARDLVNADPETVNLDPNPYTVNPKYLEHPGGVKSRVGRRITVALIWLIVCTSKLTKARELQESAFSVPGLDLPFQDSITQITK